MDLASESVWNRQLIRRGRLGSLQSGQRSRGAIDVDGSLLIMGHGHMSSSPARCQSPP